MHVTVCVEVKGQFCGPGSVFLPLSVSRRWNSGRQACTASTTESSLQLQHNFMELKCKYIKCSDFKIKLRILGEKMDFIDFFFLLKWLTVSTFQNLKETRLFYVFFFLSLNSLMIFQALLGSIIIMKQYNANSTDISPGRLSFNANQLQSIYSVSLMGKEQKARLWEYGPQRDRVNNLCFSRSQKFHDRKPREWG